MTNLTRLTGPIFVLYAILMSLPAFAGTPIINPPVHKIPFLSYPASGPLYAGPGATLTIIGKSISSTATTGSLAHCNGCAGVNIQGADFDVENTTAILIENAGTPANPIPITIIHTRHKNPVFAVHLINSTAAPSSTITHNEMKGITSKFQHFIDIGNNSGGLSSDYCTARGLNVANCVLKLWYNRIDGRDPVTNADPIYPAGSSGIVLGDGATLASTGYTTVIYDTLIYPGAVGIDIKGGTSQVLYYNEHYSTPDVSGAIASVRVSKDPASVRPAVPPAISVSYGIQDDATGHLPMFVDDGSMGNTTYSSNVDYDVNLNGDVNGFVGPE